MQVSKRRLSAACILLILAVCAACWYPFNFNPANSASILDEGRGLQFTAPAYRSRTESGGLGFVRRLACRNDARCAPGEIGLRVELSAASEAGDCLKRIVDLRAPDGREQFFVGQWKSYLIVRAFSDISPGKAYREIGIDGALAGGRKSFIVITSGPGGTSLYLNGRQVRTHPDLRLLDPVGSLKGIGVYIGNAPDLNCPWSGVVSKLALYGTGLHAANSSGETGTELGCSREAVACYDFEAGTGSSDRMVPDLSGNGNDLRLDKRLAFEKSVLRMPRLERNIVSDILANLIGFIPVGLAFSAWCSAVTGMPDGKSAWLGCLLGCAFSLILEIVQAWLPSRDSSLLDLAMNTLGAGLGSVGFLVVGARVNAWSGRA